MFFEPSFFCFFDYFFVIWQIIRFFAQNSRLQVIVLTGYLPKQFTEKYI